MQPQRRPTVAVDLDGVLAKWDGKWRGVEEIGEPVDGAVEFTKELSKLADIVVWTTRTNPDVNFEFMMPELRQMVVAWLNQHGFVYRAVYTGQGKPLAAAYVDDRAVVCQPEKYWPHSSFSQALDDVRKLLPGPIPGKGDPKAA